MWSAHQKVRQKKAAFWNFRGNQILHYVLMLCTYWLLLGGMLDYGWFYDRDYMRAALVIMPVALWLVWRAIMHRGHLETKNRVAISIPWPLLFPFIAALFYAVCLLGSPVSVQGTWMQIIRWTGAGAWVIVLVHLSAYTSRADSRAANHNGMFRHDKQQWAHKLVTVSGFVLSGGSLFQLYGWMKLDGAVYFSSNAKMSALGFRLGGWLQYPNTLGTIAGAFAVYHLLDTYRRLQVLQSSPPIQSLQKPQLQGIKHVYRRLLYSKGFKAVIATGLILLHLTVLGLTESRGAWLVIMFVLLVAWLMAPRKEKLSLFLFMLWLLSWALLSVLATASLWLSDTLRSVAWIPLFGCMLSNTLLLLIATYVKRRVKKERMLLVIGTSMVILVVTWLAWAVAPDQASDRLTGGHYETASARVLIYQDAWRLWQERPWFGSGGDAWRQQFSSIQHEPYVGKEAHSVFVDSLLDIGLAGTFVVGGMIAVAVIGAWRRHQGAAAAVLIVILHSLIDFDMAYGLVIWISLAWLVIAWLTPVGNQVMTDKKTCDADARSRERSTANDSGNVPLAKRQRFRLSPYGLSLNQRSIALFLTIVLGTGVVMNVLQVAGHMIYNVGRHVDNPSYLRFAVGLSPANTGMRLAVAEQLPPDESLAMLREGLRYERRGKALYRALALASERSGREEDAAAWWNAAVQADRFDKALQTEAVERLAAMSLRAAEQGRSAEARALALATQDCFSQYNAEVRRIEALVDPANDKQFAITPEALRASASVDRLTWP
ncbi:O-antigen ligase family protein [Paenibacillus sp. SC116]|uniref:O-antigen ligase family protein n=1 Tax=Paenibacillus sp. SC116 TaxID=2968986 RepID=UPI00215A3785|nr:O-antigen ligase family protein [Paenibacillus sp. SC116]MCR8846293.1 O-antigen ligase family protein [Paenibacillus sp. SC116]